MTGTMLSSQIKAIFPGLPIILCTGADREFTATDHELASIDAVIRKPFGTKDIALAIRKILDKVN